jgi:hypothetical protein
MNNKKKSGPNVAHRMLDEMAKFEAGMSAKMAELVAKHNEITAKQAALEGALKNIASAIGNQFAVLFADRDVRDKEYAGALSGLDLNILALAEMMKEVFCQLRKTDVYIDNDGSPSNEAVEKIKEEGEKWMEEVTKSAFKVVQDRLTAEAEVRKAAFEAEKKAKEEAAKAEVEKTEAQSVEAELRNAETVDRAVVAATSGGGGSVYPEGAEIFGGQ